MDILNIILSAVMVILGVLYCFFGFKYIRKFFFAYGFIFAGLVAYSVIFALSASLLFAVLGGIAVGAVAGWLMYFFYRVGIFLTGVGLGVILACILIAIFGIPFAGVFGIILIVALGIAGGILTIKLKRPYIIITTSISGAAFIAYFGYALVDKAFFGGSIIAAMDISTIKEAFSAVFDLPFAAIAVMIVFTIAGMIVQFKTAPRSITK